MMDRRSFLMKNVPAAALTSAAFLSPGPSSAAQTSEGESAKSRYYQFVMMRLEFGEQVGRILGWFENRAFPLFQKHKLGPIGIYTVEVGPAIPAVIGIFTYPSLADIEATWAGLAADSDWAAAHAEIEGGNPAFYREDVSLLRATAFSPPLKASASGDPAHKIYELRIYESATLQQLGYLHDRFAGGEIEIFHKSGIHPMLYADTVIGPNMPNMAYLIPFESEGSREKSWAAFRNHPDWAKIRDESVRRGGEIVRNITNMILAPAGFSMLR